MRDKTIAIAGDVVFSEIGKTCPAFGFVFSHVVPGITTTYEIAYYQLLLRTVRYLPQIFIR